MDLFSAAVTFVLYPIRHIVLQYVCVVSDTPHCVTQSMCLISDVTVHGAKTMKARRSGELPPLGALGGLPPLGALAGLQLLGASGGLPQLGGLGGLQPLGP